MMADVPTTNRAMFWRIIRRLLTANRTRLFVILLALGAGASVTAALLNLQIDARRRLTTEFRAFGPNALVTSRNSSDAVEPGTSTIDATVLQRLPEKNGVDAVRWAALLYGIVTVVPADKQTGNLDSRRAPPAVLVGYASTGQDITEIFPSTPTDRKPSPNPRRVEMFALPPGTVTGEMGEQLAARLGVSKGDVVEIRSGDEKLLLCLTNVKGFGGPEDNQIFVWLSVAQTFLNKPDRISTITLNVPGSPSSVRKYLAELQSSRPDVEVHGLSGFTDAQRKIYDRISGLLTATVGIVLLLTALCVMAAMTNVAMERKNDVGLMKAIGGSVRRVMRLFLAEAALLGLAGGLIGAAVGILVSIGLGKAVFGVAANPRWIVYPISVALTIIVAIISAYPLRRLAAIRPASVFRGEA